MTAPISDNPNSTRGRVRSAGSTNLSFPVAETPSSRTRLRFVTYNRFNPGDTATEDTSSTITLPLPMNIPENYSMNTTGHDMGALGMLNNRNAEAAMDLTKDVDWSNLKSITTSGMGVATESIKRSGFDAKTALAGLLAMRSGNDMSNSISAFTGIVKNPHTTVIFDGVNLRTITLEWRFSARSEEDSNMLKRIYDEIKLRIHPEEVAYGYALNYPDLLYIEFDGKAGEYLPKFRKAMVNSIHITPDSSGGIPLFKSGAPVSYNFQLVATEIEILTRNILNEQINGAE